MEGWRPWCPPHIEKSQEPNSHGGEGVFSLWSLAVLNCSLEQFLFLWKRERLEKLHLGGDMTFCACLLQIWEYVKYEKDLLCKLGSNIWIFFDIAQELLKTDVGKRECFFEQKRYFSSHRWIFNSAFNNRADGFRSLSATHVFPWGFPFVVYQPCHNRSLSLFCESESIY